MPFSLLISAHEISNIYILMSSLIVIQLEKKFQISWSDMG